MRAVCAGLFAAALLSGCSARQPDYTPQAGIVILDSPTTVAGNAAAVPAQQSPDEIMRINAADAARADTLRRAHADCVYQAQMANVMSPGLLNGFLNGIGAGAVCQNYYRNVGVMR